ncbi:MAG: tetratricopeptide repeat protein [Pirellulales bacterium]|nr:tetratricopeptide repeat protein [Pirellulales bacterium]
MQRYRINHQLIIGLFIGTIALFVAAYFLRSWQVKRKAGDYRELAAQKLAESEILEAFQYQTKYVLLRPNEDDARIELANIALEVIELAEAPREERGKALGVLQETVRRTGDAPLRLKLAELIISSFPSERAIDGLNHVEELLRDAPNDAELNELKVRALYRAKDFRRANELASGLVGFDRKSKEFVDDKVIVGNEPDIYYLLAQGFHRSAKDREYARTVIDRMVEVNPDSPEAYLKQSIFLQQLGEKEAAAIALDKAYEVDPTDAMVLQQKGSLASRNEDYDKAYEIFKEALEKHPENLGFYRSLVIAEFSRKNFEQALAILDEGIVKFGERRGVELILLKIEAQINSRDYAGVEKTLKDLENLAIPGITPNIDFARARVTLDQGKWSEAAKELKRVRPLLIDSPAYQAMAGTLLASCYERLGKLDLARQTYNLVLNDFPNNKKAAQALQRVNEKLGFHQVDQENTGLNSLIRETLALPEEEQNWEQIDDALSEIAEQNNLSELQTLLIRIKISLQRKKFTEAERLIQAAAEIEPDNLGVRYAAVALSAMDPKSGPSIAMKQLDAIVAEGGSTFRSRTQRAALLLSMNLDDESLVSQLRALADGIEDWNAAEQLRLIGTLAVQFQQLGKLDQARRMWNRAVELSPNNLPLRMQLFSLALHQQDNAAMREAQQVILDLVQDKEDPSYVLTEVQRKLSEFVRRNIKREELVDARKLLDKALLQRGQWHELHIIYGKLLVILDEDLEVALQHFEDALKYGPPDANAIVLQVKLLEKIGQYDSALEKAALLSPAVKERILGNAEAVLLWKVGKKEAAYESAQRIAALNKDNAQTQAWFASFARQTDHLKEATEALHRAVELDPSQESYWLQLANLYWLAKDREQTRQTLNEAQLALDADTLPGLAAQQSVYRGQLQNAEDVYLSLYPDRQDVLRANRQMAEFYLLWARADATVRSKAYPYINRILREAYEGRTPKDDPQVVWARDQAARQLASTGDYRDTVKAQRLLESGAVDGELNLEDKILLAEILTMQRDPKSQLKAINIFDELHGKGQLQKKQVLMFAHLLNRTDDWDRCESLLTNALPVYRDDPEIWSAYVNMLIDRGEYETAAARLNRLEDLNPNSMVLIELGARLASEKGDLSKLRRLLRPLVPTGTGAIDAKQLKNVLNVAGIATRNKDYEFAERLMRFYVKRVPEAEFELTKYLALHGDSDEAVEMMKRQFADNRNAVLVLAAKMLRTRRLEFGDRYDETFDKMIASALRDDPESIARLTVKAELLEVQQRYDDSIRAYDKLLKRDDLNARTRAAALNNLGFLLALKGERLDEANDFIEQAMKTLGPIDDMLDTRAVVRIARNEYDLAVEDMTLATSISQDPVKYYHLAKAHVLAGNEQAALKAWEAAKSKGYKTELLPLLEQSSAQDIEKQLENLRSRSARL